VAFTNGLDLNAAGVRASGADGVLTLLGLGDGADESLTIDLDNAGTNVIQLGTGSGATTLNLNSTMNFAMGSTSPFGFLSVNPPAGKAHAFVIGSSTKTILDVKTNGDVLFGGGDVAASSTIYLYSKAAGKGGSIILEDIDGAGCTEIYTLNGAISGANVTCPTEE